MNVPRPKLMLIRRLEDVERESFEHERRIQRLETAMSSILTTQEDALVTARATHALVTSLAPDVVELKKQSNVVKLTKRGGAYGLFGMLVLIAENYGPAILKWFIGSN